MACGLRVVLTCFFRMFCDCSYEHIRSSEAVRFDRELKDGEMLGSPFLGHQTTCWLEIIAALPMTLTREMFLFPLGLDSVKVRLDAASLCAHAEPLWPRAVGTL